MNLVIDVGNTKIKMAIFQEDSQILDVKCVKKEFQERLYELFKNYPIKNTILSSVGAFSEVDLKKVSQLQPNLVYLSNNTKVPLENYYSSPETLGVDRIALASAAIYKYPQTNVLVIDAGTCITYDFVNEEGQYLGGSISPGITMRFQALHKFTAQLPELTLENQKELIGRSTDQSIQSGVVFGVIGEISSIINRYKQKNKKLTVVLTGGDTNFLAKRLKNGIFAHPNFLLEGLNAILNYNR